MTIYALSFCQVDNEFWFAVPEVTSQHADKPVLLHISSLDAGTSVTITVPSNNMISPLTFTLEPYTTRSIDLIDEFANLNLLENIKPNTITNKGLLIKSTNKISAYYEVLGTSTAGYGVVNTDIFTLKGSNALGKEFYTPFQTSFDNYPFAINPDAWSSIDIVATKENTKVTITPSTDLYDTIENIKANTSITIILNKGQTYSVRNASQLAENSLSGSHIISDKPIAVTIKDDSVLDETGISYDLIGDQLIPMRILGTEYVTGGGFLYLVATEDSTLINISYTNYSGEISTIDTILNRGKTLAIVDLVDKPLENSFHILTSVPTYIFLIKQLGNEYGGAAIPAINCTGSRHISVANTAEETLIFEVVTKTENAKNFMLNGVSYNFGDSANSNNWFYGYAYLDAQDYPLNKPIIIENSSGAFHLGVVNGGNVTGVRFGYFSNFGTLELGSDQSICLEETSTLDAGQGRDSYEWSQVGNPSFTSNEQTIDVKETGKYIVKITEGSCKATDTIIVSVNAKLSPIDIAATTKFCDSDSIVLLGPTDATVYRWQDNSTESTFTVTEPGEYKLYAANSFGCSDSATVSIDQFPIPEINTVDEISICESSTYTVTLDEGYERYNWYLNDNILDNKTNSYTFDEEGKYSVSIANFCGMDSASINFQFWAVEIPNVITPNNDGKNDKFIIKGIEQGEWDLTIYNRWGKQTYRDNNFKNNWVSTEENGAYYYLLQHQDDCNEFKGWLYIIGED